MGVNTKAYNNATDMISFSRASGGYGYTKVSYGSQLVTNGGFDDATGWTAGGTLFSIGGGVATAAGVTYNVDYQDTSISLVSGKVYVLSFDVTGYTSGSPRFDLVGIASLISGGISATGTYTHTFVSTGTATRTLRMTGSTGFTGTLDNISVKEVTYNDPNGTLQLIYHPDDIPRVEYDANGVAKGLLIEEQRTNLVTYSEQFDNAAWAKTNVTVTANAAVAPDGTITADLLTQSVVSSLTVQLFQGLTISTGVTYTYSVFIKQNDCEDFIKILLGSGNQSSGFGVSIDPSDMSVQYANAAGTGYTYLTHEVNSVGNGWYKVSVTGSSSTTTSVSGYIAFNDSANGSHASDRVTNGGTGSVYIWGAQVEAGSFPTSYIATTGASASRSADLASISVDQFGYNQAQGSVVVEANPIPVGSGFGTKIIVNINDGTVNDEISLINENNDRLQFIMDPTGAANDVNFTISGAEGELKYAAAWALNNANAAHGGVLGAGDTSVTPIQTATTMTLSSDANGAAKFSGHIKYIAYYPRRLSNAQLQTIVPYTEPSAVISVGGYTFIINLVQDLVSDVVYDVIN